MESSKHHYRSFWPLIIIAVVAALVGGIILGKAYGNQLEDNLNSITTFGHKQVLQRQISTTTPTEVKSTTTNNSTN